MLKPNLIIQLHRIGDLILTFPLAKKMKELEPNRPLWLVAEQSFYNALLPLAPEVVFIPPNADILKQTAFKQVINLSQRPESGILAGQIQAEKYIGLIEQQGIKKIHGFWQLYRASLVCNSRHNLFHWSDLNALDILTLPEIKSIKYAIPHREKQTNRIGLFLGASQESKRPSPKFYGELAAKLLARGLEPVFLGGKADMQLGASAAHYINAHARNLCGHFTLAELLIFLNELDLLITPDTGPMHMAAAFGLPTLCLSMGNVNAWETAASNPSHHVLRANMSCLGCWECTRKSMSCKEAFTPAKVATVTKYLLESQKNPYAVQVPKLPRLSLYKTEREEGLFALKNLSSTKTSLHFLLSKFWQEYFLFISNTNQDFSTPEILITEYPYIINVLHEELLGLSKSLRNSIKNRKTLNKDFWLHTFPLIRPLSAYIQMMLENENYSLQAMTQSLEYCSKLSGKISIHLL